MYLRLLRSVFSLAHADGQIREVSSVFVLEWIKTRTFQLHFVLGKRAPARCGWGYNPGWQGKTR